METFPNTFKAVNLKAVNFSKFEQTIPALNFNHICEELDSEDFKEEFCKCKDFLVEISIGNILGDIVQKWLHIFKF
jgi:hypothetical protein